MSLKLVYWPSPVLKQISESLTEAPSADLIAEMRQVMTAHRGIGLSAIQVGIPKRFFLAMDLVFVNPEIQTLGPWAQQIEGCLSIPGVFELVNRSHEVQITHGIGENRITENFEGLLAQTIQHEYEHLDGKLFVDRLTNAQRSKIMGTIQALRRAGKLKG